MNFKSTLASCNDHIMIINFIGIILYVTFGWPSGHSWQSSHASFLHYASATISMVTCPSHFLLLCARSRRLLLIEQGTDTRNTACRYKHAQVFTFLDIKITLTVTLCVAVHVRKSNNKSQTCHHRGRAKLGYLNICTYN